VSRATRDDIQKMVWKKEVRLVKKSESWLMRVAGFLVRPFNKRFMTHYWTTIGRTIYYPDHVDDPCSHVAVMDHELVHIDQWLKWWILHPISYAVFPLPIVLCWGRWRWEREAYLVSIKTYGYSVERVVEVLWSEYLLTWPKPWMRSYFERRLSGE
jgi:hypothetical protein